MMKSYIVNHTKKIGIKTLKPFKIDKNIKSALQKISSTNEKNFR